MVSEVTIPMLKGSMTDIDIVRVDSLSVHVQCETLTR